MLAGRFWRYLFFPDALSRAIAFQHYPWRLDSCLRAHLTRCMSGEPHHLNIRDDAHVVFGASDVVPLGPSPIWHSGDGVPVPMVSDQSGGSLLALSLIGHSGGRSPYPWPMHGSDASPHSGPPSPWSMYGSGGFSLGLLGIDCIDAVPLARAADAPSL